MGSEQHTCPVFKTWTDSIFFEYLKLVNQPSYSVGSQNPTIRKPDFLKIGFRMARTI